MTSFKLPDISDRIPLKLQLEEYEFIRDRWKEKQLELTSLQIAQLYIQIFKIKGMLKNKNDMA